MSASARVPVVVEVRHYLDGLVWAGKPRLASWTADYLGAKPGYGVEAGLWMVSAVARVYQPGCRADGVLLLTAPQGAGKSQAMRALAQPFFSDQAIDVRPGSAREFALTVHSAWVVEVDLEAIPRAEWGLLKEALWRRQDSVRAPYEREPKNLHRSCVFAASITRPGFVGDVGRSGFWPVYCGKIDHEAIERDRDQLWAEALSAYGNGARWWIDAR